jgi:hypothetical protein
VNAETSVIAQRAALYLRVSTVRQAEHTFRSPTRSGRARRTAPRAATGSSTPLSKRVHRPPTTAAPSSSA